MIKKTLFTFISALLLYSAIAQDSTRLAINHLTGDCYVFTTWQEWKGQRIPSNGMYVVTGIGVILIDNPWDTTQVRPLLDSIRHRHKRPVIMAISTHFHDDRTGAVDILHNLGIKTYATQRTIDLCVPSGKNIPRNTLADDHSFTASDHKIQIYYPGPGHAPDNIVVWVERDSVLFGGCFVKSSDSNDLGNLSDANVREWPESAKRTRKRYAEAKYIVPGHGIWNDNKGLDQTLKLLSEKQ